MDLQRDRRKKGYNQKDYAKLIGVSERTLRYWESGAIEIPPMKIAHLKEAMKAIKSIRVKR